MKKILFVISYLDKGGAERALSNITMNFPDEYQLDILVNSDRVIDYEYKANIISMGLDCPTGGMSVPFQLCVLLKRFKVLRKLKKANNYIACISFLDSANIANILSGKRYCKTIISIRNSVSQSINQWQFKYIVNPLSRLLYNQADKIVAVSRGVALELQQYFRIRKEKIVSIENGYPVDHIRELAKEKLNGEMVRVFENNKVIISVGRLTHQKGGQHLIRAFSRVHENNKNTVLIILGEGELREYYEELIGLNNLQDCVYLPGYESNPYKYVSRADVFVMPSLYEGFPNAMAEAMCLGVPCIATDFSTGAKELLAPKRVKEKKSVKTVEHEEYGILVPLCSGHRLKCEKLEREEMDLCKAMEEVLLNDDIQSFYEKRSSERALALNIEDVINRWTRTVWER